VDFSGFGLNMRMSPFSAVVAKELLKDLDKILSNRRGNLKQLLGIISQNTDKILLPEIPKYANFNEISWYSYKPILNNISLNELKVIKPWKFSDLGYTYISNSNYWQKDQRYFPFNFGIRPILQGDYDGTKKYLTNRISLGIPSIESDYWNENTLKIWTDSIKKI
jgi:dTDP-4-amino-4,6-dideoxygalactose transaminase